MISGTGKLYILPGGGGRIFTEMIMRRSPPGVEILGMEIAGAMWKDGVAVLKVSRKWSRNEARRS